jgi:hypothetical protein
MSGVSLVFALESTAIIDQFQPAQLELVASITETISKKRVIKDIERVISEPPYNAKIDQWLSSTATKTRLYIWIFTSSHMPSSTDGHFSSA